MADLFLKYYECVHVPIIGLKFCLIDARQIFGLSMAELSLQTFWHALQRILRHNLRHIFHQDLTISWSDITNLSLPRMFSGASALASTFIGLMGRILNYTRQGASIYQRAVLRISI